MARTTCCPGCGAIRGDRGRSTLSCGCAAGTSNGYDGQYAYYIARDPAHAAGCLDVPAYRYQRILLPVLGRVLALGNTDAIPAAFVLINLVALVGSTALLT